jgi:hypothetical protein
MEVQSRAITFLTANVTSWRASLLGWIVDKTPDLVMLQETKQKDASSIQAKFASVGYGVHAIPAVSTVKGGTSGGLALAYRRHLNVRSGHAYTKDGNGYSFSFFRVKDRDIAVGTIYLLSGSTLQSDTNAAILAHLACFVKSLCMEWVLIGDWNLTPEVLFTTSLTSELRAAWVHTGEATVANGGELDFAMASHSIAPFLTVIADWDTPFRPHAALRWTLQVGDFRVAVPQLQPFKRQELQVSEFQPLAAGPVEVLDSKSANPSLDGAFANLSCAVEHAVYNSQGRGVTVRTQRKPLVATTPTYAAWGGKAHTSWKRLCIALHAFSIGRVDAQALRRGLSTAEHFWLSGDRDVFTSRLATLAPTDLSACKELLQVAAEHAEEHLRVSCRIPPSTIVRGSSVPLLKE